MFSSYHSNILLKLILFVIPVLGVQSKLANSIKEIGLINPIAITKNNILLSGLHRLEACRRLQHKYIEAKIIKTTNDLYSKLIEIDENLIRNELSILERSEQFKERKEIFETLYPNISKKGGDRGNQYTGGKWQSETVSLCQNLSDKIGVSKRTIQQEIQIASNIDSKVKEKIRENKLENNKRLLLKLARIPVKEQLKMEKQSSCRIKLNRISTKDFKNICFN